MNGCYTINQLTEKFCNNGDKPFILGHRIYNFSPNNRNFVLLGEKGFPIGKDGLTQIRRLYEKISEDMGIEGLPELEFSILGDNGRKEIMLENPNEVIATKISIEGKNPCYRQRITCFG